MAIAGLATHSSAGQELELSSAGSASESNLAARLRATEQRLAEMQQDLANLQAEAKKKAAQLELANRQLQIYARDLRTAYLGDLEKARRDSVMRLFRAS